MARELQPTTQSERLRPPWLAGAARRLAVGDNLLLSVVFFTSPLATSVAPRLTPLFVTVVGITLIGSALRRGMHWRELLPYQPALAACLVFAAYVLLSATWSADPLAGLGKAALLLGLILFTFAAVRAAAELEKMALCKAGVAFAAGALLGALFIMVELFTHGIVTRTVVTWFPSLVSRKHFDISNGVITEIRLSKLDQNVNLALFHLWPGLLALFGLASTRRTIAMAVFFAAIAAVIALSKHDSSQVALVASSLVVLFAWKWRTLAIRSLAVVWCAAFVLVVPASFTAYGNGLHFATWLPNSARARIILWEYTAEQVFNRPLFGVGVDSTPRLSAQQKATFAREQPEGFVYPRTMGHHAHSIFMQTWSELGAIGALLLAAAGAAAVLMIFLLPITAQPFAAGTFVAFAVVGAFAWGMWQSWFMCAVALLPIYLRAASAAFTDQAKTESIS